MARQLLLMRSLTALDLGWRSLPGSLRDLRLPALRAYSARRLLPCAVQATDLRELTTLVGKTLSKSQKEVCSRPC